MLKFSKWLQLVIKRAVIYFEHLFNIVKVGKCKFISYTPNGGFFIFFSTGPLTAIKRIFPCIILRFKVKKPLFFHRLHEICLT